jgi:hypothetical protein
MGMRRVLDALFLPATTLTWEAGPGSRPYVARSTPVGAVRPGRPPVRSRATSSIRSRAAAMARPTAAPPTTSSGLCAPQVHPSDRIQGRQHERHHRPAARQHQGQQPGDGEGDDGMPGDKAQPGRVHPPQDRVRDRGPRALPLDQQLDTRSRASFSGTTSTSAAPSTHQPTWRPRRRTTSRSPMLALQSRAVPCVEIAARPHAGQHPSSTRSRCLTWNTIRGFRGAGGGAPGPPRPSERPCAGPGSEAGPLRSRRSTQPRRRTPRTASRPPNRLRCR